MVAHKNQAWVTSVLDDGDVNKAIVLAGSLRRVLTTKKLVAVYTGNISEDARELLRDKFDLALLIDEQVPHGVHAQDFAKIFAFSFSIFHKCVYLSSSTMVFQNCDDIFDIPNTFAAYVDADNIVDTSVYLYTPSIRHYKAMKKIVGNGNVWKGSDHGEFSTYFGKWMMNQDPNVGALKQKYNQKISLLEEKDIYDGLHSDLGIINFRDVHPIEIADKIISSSITTLGVVESFIADKWLTIYMEEVRTRSCLSATEDGLLETQEVGNDNEPIAIIGMACRYPGGVTNPDDFWKLLIDGREGVQKLPHHRWNKDTVILRPQTRDVSAGFLDLHVDEFDAKFFGISPKEAVFLDPQQRLLHEVTWEALEDGAIDPQSLRGSHAGVFVGSWIHDYKDIVIRTPDVDFFRIYMGNSIAAGAARLSYFLGTTGPSIATESGCSSAIVAVDMAVKSLRNRDTHLAIACGVNLLLHPFNHNMLSFVVAPDGRCKTFDAKANGFGRAEGCGVLLMKRLSEAVKDGDKIWGLIRGSAVTQEGLSKSLGTPTVHCEALAMELALRDAEVDPKDVSFIETHGTGTPVGDPMEVAAITKAYHCDGRSQPLIIGSVKTNVGHTESCSGITGIMKVILALKNQKIPRHLNFDELNPEINLDLIPAVIPVEEIVWPRVPGKPRIGGVSSFGISGTDGHIIVQESPDEPLLTTASRVGLRCTRPLHIMKVSAKTPESLDDLLQKHQDLLEREGDKINFADYAYTANVGRAEFNHRACIIAKDTQDAVKKIEQNSFDQKDVQPGVGKLCFLFTGQGSQYPGMAAELYKSSPIFRMSFDKCNRLLQKMYDISIKDTLWSTSVSAQDNLSRTLYSQTSIFCVEYALFKLWESWGVKPDYVLGHSLGEFAAAVAAGIMTLKSAIKLVAERSKLIDALPQGKMIVIRADKTTVENLFSEFKHTNSKAWLDYAALNSSDQTVLAGDSKTVDNFGEFCRVKETKTIILASTHAFHSRHMEPMLKPYAKVASKITPRSVQGEKCAYISGVEGKVLQKEDLLKPDYWVRHTREKVKFIEACKTAHAESCTFFLEVGPHPVLSALVMANIDSSAIRCFPSLRRSKDDWETILESVGKLFLNEWNGCINWKGFDEYFQRKKIALPFYPFQRKRLWPDVTAVPQKLHPLLGAPVENASAITLFQNALTVKQAPYLSDHVIGSSIVFPGAAFLEMLLSGGYSHVQCLYEDFILPRRPILLRNMRIESPLGLDDSKATTLQVVVDLQEESNDSADSVTVGYKTKVFHWHKSDEGNGHWVAHASAMFMPLVTDDAILNMDNVNIKNILETWEESTGSADLYRRLPEVGLRFGPTFQSLEKGWRNKSDNEKANIELLVAVKVPEAVNKYIAHPVLVDAMIQGAMLWNNTALGKDRASRKLQVPICINEFTWLRTSESTSRFVHVSKDGRDVVRVTMVDEDGVPLMTMTGIDFVETTASVVESMITSQSSQIPTLWEEIWRHRPGPLEMCIHQIEGAIFSEEVLETAIALNKLDPENLAVYHHLDGITVVHFLNSLYELGWKPQCGQQFSLQELMAELNIFESFTNFTRFFLKSVVEEGNLALGENEDTFIVLKSLPTKSELSTALRHTATETETSRADFKSIYQIGEKLPKILLGITPPLSVLFPESTSGAGLVDAVYETIHAQLSYASDLLINAVLSRYADAKSLSGTHNPTEKCRILEVGAGTGVHTGLFLNALKDFGLQYEYHYTDISAAFFNKAQEKYSEHSHNMVYKKFNIEDDPLLQGFSPGYYDIVIAAEVIHATRNIKESLSNLRLLLRDKGHIHILETTKHDRRLTFIFGLLDGYWRFEDFDLRKDHTCLTAKQWEDVLNSTGYNHSIAIPSFESVHSAIFAAAKENYFPNSMYSRVRHTSTTQPSWLIFGDDSQLCENLMKRLTNLGRNIFLLSKSKCFSEVTNKEFIEQVVGNTDPKAKNPTILEGVIYMWGLVDENEKTQANFLPPYLYLSQYLWDRQKMGTRTFVLTQGTVSVDELSPYKNPSPSTLVGVSKTLRTEASLDVKCIDVPANLSPDETIEHVFFELWYQEDDEDTIVYHDGKRFSPRLATLKISNDNLNLPKGSDRFQLVLPETKIIQDLLFNFLNCYTLSDNEIEVKVKAAALNFRDVFCVLKPIPQFDKINAIGTDFAGVVCGVGSKVTKWKIGDAVFGCNLNDQQALPSHIKVSEETVVPVPDYFTFAEAATLPAVFSTAFYCLVSVANIKKDDTVLIHTASGGVGLSAIQIAQHYGAKIIATAGSDRKRAYLRSIGIKHVFHSRNTDYGDQILSVTGGKGVDIVLNSLTGPGFKEATLKCCAQAARFVEMSKLSIWKPEEVKELRPDVDYTVADLTTLEETVWRELFTQMKNYVNKGVVKPIPHVRFDAVDVRNALNYLQKAKHIGKIVCIMPDIKLQDSKFTASTPLFNDRSTYLITGGITGGIGLETAKYMLSQGAKYLILVGRSKPQHKTEELLNTWKASGYFVHAWQADVGDYQQCRDLINKIKDPTNGLPPLRGVMHAAGTLSDGTLPSQSWDKFEHTFNAKVNGSWNVHNLTADMQLEHFVFFSSIAAYFGTPGQANHTAGNFFEDALAHYRNSVGLPATTINWGTWGQVGIATEVEIPGFRPLSTQQGIMALDLILRKSRLHTGVLNVESFSVFSKFCPRIKNYIDDRSLFAEVKGPTLNVNSDEFWADVDSVEDRIEKEEVFRKYIKIMIRTILKLDSEEAIDDNAEFPSLGIDSLMMLEMKNNLQNLFGSRMTVSASDLKGCNTTHLLANKLVDIYLSCAAADEILPTTEELQLLMQEDSQLPENISGVLPGVTLPSKIKTILVTGATGMLAPYILRLVSVMPQITQITCLIRKRGKMTGEERLLASLQANELNSRIAIEKIQCVDGDVGQPLLGLEEQQYEELAGSIDAIIHCSAKVDHLQRYRKTGPQEKFHLRTINVIGTKNILEFASLKQTKLVMHASTFAMIYSIDQDNGCLSEKWEPFAAPEKVPTNIGYAISKYVAEQLLKQAVERGIPCKSFRLPFIAGDSVTGWHDVRGNHAMLRFLTYMKVGAMPSQPIPIIQLPVDYCAEVAVKLFFNDDTPCDVYNIIPKYPVMEQEFIKVAESFGHNIEVVEYSEFLEKLKAIGEASPLHAFMEHYENEELINNMSSSPAIPSMKHYLTLDLQKYFYSEKVHKYCPDLYEKMESPLEMVKRDLQYLKDVGIFEKFGL